MATLVETQFVAENLLQILLGFNDHKLVNDAYVLKYMRHLNNPTT